MTGGYAGVGFELSRILYAHNAIVYVAGRSEAKALLAIDAIKVATPNSAGRLEFLQVDLSNLKTVKPGVEGFISKERRLDVLINNAGVRYANANGKTMTIVADRCWKKVMYPPAGSKDAHGNDLQLGTNCVGPCLLYLLLEPLLTRTAAASPKGSVRVAWAGSVAVDMTSPKPDGMHLEDCGRPQDKGVTLNYGQTKVGNVFLSNFYAQNTPQTGIVHSSFNPGNLKTELTRHVNPVLRVASVSPPPSFFTLSILLKAFTGSSTLSGNLWRIHRAMGCCLAGVDY